MPLPNKQLNAEQIEQRKQIVAEAIAAGVIQHHERMTKYGPNSTLRFEAICIGDRGIVNPQTFKPTTVPNWIADCQRRNVVPYAPNQG